MKTHLTAIIAAAAIALGITAAVTIGIGYNAAVANPPDDSAAANPAAAGWTPDATPSVQPSATPPQLGLPTAADIPTSFSADERANALQWLDMQDYVDACMSDAGYPEYAYTIFWQPGFDLDTSPSAWYSSMSDDRKTAAFSALQGSHVGAADYHWEDAGCQGYGSHMIGADNAN